MQAARQSSRELLGSWDIWAPRRVALRGLYGFLYQGFEVMLRGSWDLVTRATNRVAIVRITYNPKWGTYNLTF